VIRTSWVIGRVGDNFARRILRLATTRDDLSIVTDEVSIPTSAPALATATAALVDQADAGSRGGVPRLHVACRGAASRLEYAAFVLRAAEAAGVPLRVSPARLRPTTAAAFSAPARRPSDSRLDCGLAARRFGVVLPDWRLAVGEILPDILADSRD
jgi:dTDP-4-dehydrorhamnose reductase